MGRMNASALPHFHQADDHARIDTRRLRPVCWQAEVRLASDRPRPTARAGLGAWLAAWLDDRRPVVTRARLGRVTA